MQVDFSEKFPNMQNMDEKSQERPRSGPKEQFNVRLPKDLVKQIDWRVRRKLQDRGLQTIAAFLALEMLSEDTRLSLAHCAKRISLGDTEWSVVSTGLDGARTKALDDAELRALIEQLVDLIDRGIAERDDA